VRPARDDGGGGLGGQPPEREHQRLERGCVGPLRVVDEQDDRLLQLAEPFEQCLPGPRARSFPRSPEQLIQQTERDRGLRRFAARAQDPYAMAGQCALHERRLARARGTLDQRERHVAGWREHGVKRGQFALAADEDRFACAHSGPDPTPYMTTREM
jgi:hypothetical protein